MRLALHSFLIVFTASLPADVFLRQPAGVPQEWQRAYSAPFRLQNSKGDLELYHSEDPLVGIETALKSRHGDALAWVAGELMAWGLVIEKGWLIRYLVQPLPDGGSWIVRYKQPVRSAGKPGDTPKKHLLKELPVYPQSKPSFYSHDEGNRVSLEVSESTSSPQAALQTLSEMIINDGWTPSPLNTGGFQVFVRGEKVAFLGAQRGKDGVTRILRLHKPLGVK